jgi:hypothetical protein
MFRFLAATNAAERMSELERFVEFWYGPRRPEFGVPDTLTRYPTLPDPLRRFYAFAGRWPSLDLRYDAEFFYTGAGGHHLLAPDAVGPAPDGRLRFFMEYQGDWDGVTLPGERDPPVWISGRWDEPEKGAGRAAGRGRSAAWPRAEVRLRPGFARPLVRRRGGAER